MKPFAKRIALVMGVVACALAASAVAEEYMAPPSGLSEEGRHAFREFLEARYHKAFAIGRHGAFGWRSGRSSAEEAIEEALATCRRYASDCELVMVDDERGGGRPPPQSYSPP
ncbi:MAG TPA: hypothetical protein HPQ04_05930, partial [Rhodospirillaceae bacterium]|nr:hypothetical protein [Rhodospirillaceae bacterium]